MSTADNRTPSGRFAPGRSGNPGGRRKGLTREVRDRFGENGERLVEILAEIVEGTATGCVLGRSMGEPVPVQVEASVRERLDAAELLLAYGFGKPTQSLELAGPGGGPIPVEHRAALVLDDLRDADLQQLEQLLTRALPPAQLDDVIEGDLLELPEASG